jgi:Zn-finger nucleic acid-binding protein
MEETGTLICPKCRGEMHSYERNGVVVDQCGECRGIFLDRGELEQLLDAETGAHREGHDKHGRVTDARGEDRHGKRRRSAGTLLEGLLGGGE